MGFNSKAYLDHEERRALEQPKGGGYRQRRTALSDLWAAAERVKELEEQERLWEEERNKKQLR